MGVDWRGDRGGTSMETHEIRDGALFFVLKEGVDVSCSTSCFGWGQRPPLSCILRHIPTTINYLLNREIPIIIYPSCPTGENCEPGEIACCNRRNKRQMSIERIS